jgi:hypothetical protein
MLLRKIFVNQSTGHTPAFSALYTEEGVEVSKYIETPSPKGR